MSGFEVASLVLSAWRQIANCLASNTFRGEYVRKLRLRVETEEEIYTMTILSLLQDAVPGMVRFRLISKEDPRQLWKDPSVYTILENRLGPAQTPVFLHSLAEMERLLQSVLRSLQAEIDARPYSVLRRFALDLQAGLFRDRLKLLYTYNSRLRTIVVLSLAIMSRSSDVPQSKQQLEPAAPTRTHLPLTETNGSELDDGMDITTIMVPHLSSMYIEQTLENDYDFPEQPGSLSVEEQEILEIGSAEGSWGVFRCEHPSCWDQKDKFRFNVFADLAHHYKNSHPAVIESEEFPCSYSSCKRFEDPFTRKDAYRDHLREYHLEDMLKRHKKQTREQEWWASRIISPLWWRCVRCVGPTINVQQQGWLCTTCQQNCEAERITLRKSVMISTLSSGPHTSENHVRVLPDYDTETSDQPGSSKHDRSSVLTDSTTIRQEATVHTAKDSVTTTGLVESRMEKPFSHFEYASHKVVPFTTIKQLGHGSLGSVDAVRQNGNVEGPVLARKVIRLPNMSRKRLLPLIQQEVAVLRELKHKHIVQVISTYETTSVPRQFGILLWPAGEEDLSHYLERVSEEDFPGEDMQRLKRWQYCLASAVAYIHSRNIRHKDIKPSNAICKGDDILLTDFGSAHQFSAGLTSSTEGYAAGVTKMYSAPEVISLDRRGRPADIFSLGCVFAEMATVAAGRGIEEFHEFRSEPVPDEPERMTLCYYATAHKLGPWFAGDEDPWPYKLISMMTAEDQMQRPSAEKVLSLLVDQAQFSNCSCRFVSDPGYRKTTA